MPKPAQRHSRAVPPPKDPEEGSPQTPRRQPPRRGRRTGIDSGHLPSPLPLPPPSPHRTPRASYAQKRLELVEAVREALREMRVAGGGVASDRASRDRALQGLISHLTYKTVADEQDHRDFDSDKVVETMRQYRLGRTQAKHVLSVASAVQHWMERNAGEDKGLLEALEDLIRRVRDAPRRILSSPSPQWLLSVEQHESTTSKTNSTTVHARRISRSQPRQSALSSPDPHLLSGPIAGVPQTPGTPAFPAELPTETGGAAPVAEPSKALSLRPQASGTPKPLPHPVDGPPPISNHRSSTAVSLGKWVRADSHEDDLAHASAAKMMASSAAASAVAAVNNTVPAPSPSGHNNNKRGRGIARRPSDGGEGNGGAAADGSDPVPLPRHHGSGAKRSRLH